MEAIQNSSCESDQTCVRKSNKCEPTSYRNKTHMVKLFEVLESLRKDEVLCDVRLQTDDGTIVVGHKVVLASASPYFRAMLTNFDESDKNIFKITELNSIILELLVDYIYSGEVTITEQNVKVLLEAANRLQFDDVKAACAMFLQSQLNPSNCIGTKAIADVYNCVELLSCCDTYIKKQFLEVSKYNEFLSLSAEEVIEIISCNDLTVQFEHKVFESVMNWVRHELDNRYESLPKLMEHVRLPLVSIDNLTERVVNEPLLKNSPQCKDYVIEALNFHLLKTKLLKTIPQTIRTTPRQSGQGIILFNNASGGGTEANYYDPKTNLLQIVPQMSSMNKGAIALIKEHLVFSVGHNISSIANRSVAMLDLSLQLPCWVPTVDMVTSRGNLGVGVLDDCIYAVGGYNNYEGYTKSAEIFNVSDQKWQLISSMSCNRSDLGVGVLNGCLYAVGGYDGSSSVKSVECYDPTLEIWSPVAEMSECRMGLGVGVLDDVMYAIGGNNGLQHLKSVEAYKPSTGVWSKIADMHLCHTFPGVFVFEGLLYVIGGRNSLNNSNPPSRSSRRFMKFLEVYNPNTNTWLIKPLSKSLLCSFGAVVVNRHFTCSK